ncbi:MAG TPA: ABC transporter permease, partial [Thermoanaerobaculia bacterium]|nr:ABC transporter permease [Thermoanaerobaculia bacterium]
AAGRALVGEERGALALRSALVALQVAVSVMLLTGAALVGQSLGRLLAVDPGFEPAGRWSGRIAISGSAYRPAERAAFFEEVARRVSALPGVERAGLVNRLPLAPSASCDSFVLGDRPLPEPGAEDCAEERVADAGYFATLGMRVDAGRALDERDRDGSAPVVVVNRAMAERYWPGASPLGRTFKWGDAGSEDPWREVVGVVEDVRHFGLAAAAEPEVYMPIAQQPWSEEYHLVASAAVAPRTITPAVREVVRKLDPTVAVDDVATMRERIAGSVAPERLRTAVLGLFAGVALAMTVLGLFGVMSQTVTRRAREVGLRLALGAARSAVLALVMRQGLALLLAGIGLGLAGALAARRALGGLLFGVEAGDPRTLAGGVVLVAVVAGLAILLPALRSLRVDPAVTLREE